MASSIRNILSFIGIGGVISQTIIRMGIPYSYTHMKAQDKYTLLNTFNGNYRITRNVGHKRPYVQTEQGSLEITTEFQNNTCVLNLRGELIEILKNGVRMDPQIKHFKFEIPDKPTHSDDTLKLKNRTFIRGSSIVNEGIAEGLFGSPVKNAQVFSRVGNVLKREVYLDYSFKNVFGGYCFPNEKVHIWTKID